MAALVDADPSLDPDERFARLPHDVWAVLVFQIVGQQLSLASAAATLARIEALFGGVLPTPSQLRTLDQQTLREAGLSLAKSRYLHELAVTFDDGQLDPRHLEQLDDDGARAELVQLNGVGRFTADGVLMVALRRTDIWPAADLAFRRAVERVWELDAPASVAEIDALGEPFRPWRTLAATYLYAEIE